MTHNGAKNDRQRSAPFGLSHDAFGRLVLIDAEGRRHVGVDPIRAFPLTVPDQYISLCNEHGHEVASIEDLDELPAGTRAVLEEELARREFVPVIQRIVRVTGDGGPSSQWSVDTDRGATRFIMEGADDIRALGPTRAMITDAQGVRYLVADSQKLDAASRRILERFI